MNGAARESRREPLTVSQLRGDGPRGLVGGADGERERAVGAEALLVLGDHEVDRPLVLLVGRVRVRRRVLRVVHRHHAVLAAVVPARQRLRSRGRVEAQRVDRAGVVRVDDVLHADVQRLHVHELLLGDVDAVVVDRHALVGAHHVVLLPRVEVVRLHVQDAVHDRERARLRGVLARHADVVHAAHRESAVRAVDAPLAQRHAVEVGGLDHVPLAVIERLRCEKERETKQTVRDTSTLSVTSGWSFFCRPR